LVEISGWAKDTGNDNRGEDVEMFDVAESTSWRVRYVERLGSAMAEATGV
jgi:hypothetical protein